MAKRSKRYCAFYEYLAPYLKSGNALLIQQAKMAYRREYKAKWRKANRKENKVFTVSFSKVELRLLTNAAKAHRLKPTSFIKQATLGYIDKRYVVPTKAEVNKIIQLLSMTYNSIDGMSEGNRVDSGSLRKIQLEILELEHKIRVTLFSPKTIEQLLSEELQKHPDTKDRVLQFFETITG